MSGTFHLNQGNVLNILVGGQGAGGGSDYVGNYYAPSGGGGSFVAGGLGGPSSLLMAAGGGGGVDPWTEKSTDTGAADASTGTSGKHATGTDRSNQEGAGGTDGSGGTIGIDSANDGGGGGGGGFSGNGGSHVGGGKAQGGFAYLNGGAGGAGGGVPLELLHQMVDLVVAVVVGLKVALVSPLLPAVEAATAVEVELVPRTKQRANQRAQAEEVPILPRRPPTSRSRWGILGMAW